MADFNELNLTLWELENILEDLKNDWYEKNDNITLSSIEDRMDRF